MAAPIQGLILTLQRSPSVDGATFGRLHVDGRLLCDTLEDAVHGGPKVQGSTAIPAGTYSLDLTYSPRFKRVLPLVHDVPGFAGVRIHAGNTIADTEGCILVGTRARDKLVRSRLMVDALVQVLERAGGPVSLHVVDAQPAGEGAAEQHNLRLPPAGRRPAR
jgi:hypothetical protein